MGRVVRTLLKVPAVRRVMVRLANLEDAITKQQASLGAFDGHRERWSADQAAHVARLAGLEDTVAKQQASLDGHWGRLSADQAGHMARLAALEDAVAKQQESFDRHWERLAADQTGRAAKLEEAIAALHDESQRQQAHVAG